jgi:NADPH2:quinone reductase
MPKAMIVQETGGPEVLKAVNIAKPKAPGKGQVLLKHTAIGVNYLDIYYRKGIYTVPKYPMIPGMEGCGIVEAVGEGVKIPVGTKVIYATAQTGSYCEYRLIKAAHLVGVPESVPDDIAIAGFCKALTAHYMLFRCYQLQKGQTILVHAAAGGVGSMMTQMAKYMGAKVIGTVSTEAKAKVAKENGCDHVIIYTQQDFSQEVMKITNNKGVHVVYDGVGKDTFKKSIACVMEKGLLVTTGQPSGSIPPFNILSIAQKAIYLTRPTLMIYTKDPRELMLSAIEVFTMMGKKIIKPKIYNKYPLEKAAEAHAAIEARKTTGSSILIP